VVTSNQRVPFEHAFLPAGDCPFGGRVARELRLDGAGVRDCDADAEQEGRPTKPEKVTTQELRGWPVSSIESVARFPGLVGLDHRPRRKAPVRTSPHQAESLWAPGKPDSEACGVSPHQAEGEVGSGRWSSLGSTSARRAHLPCPTAISVEAGWPESYGLVGRAYGTVTRALGRRGDPPSRKR